MAELLKSYELGDMTASYLLNSKNQVVLLLLPKEMKAELLSQKNANAYERSSLVHLQLSEDSAGMFSNSFKLSETLDRLHYKSITEKEDEAAITVITT